MSGPRVLVVDDRENIVNLLRRVLTGTFDVATAADGQRALAMATARDFDVLLSDIRMPGLDGLGLLREVKRARPDTEVILMTAYGSAPDAVQAMKDGAYDYLTKPVDPDQALLVVQKAAERKHLREQARDLRAALDAAPQFQDLIGNGPAMRKVFDLIQRAAPADATVLITGESGTGKELVARAVHRASPRAARRFVPVNCSAIPENLIESELFGHVKGSFTGAVADKRGLFEEADGGTLLLDEVGELPASLQVKLTRALQEKAVRRVGSNEERKVDVRVIAATNADLKVAVAAGRFRDDLYYRLNVFPIRMPPLRDRKEDVPALAAFFLDRHARAGKPAPERFDADALAALVRYDWPGNVRELENAVERAMTVVDGPRIGVEALPEEVATIAGSSLVSGNVTSLSYHEVIDLSRDRVSREYLTSILKEFGGNVTRAAERAGMTRESMHRLLRRYGVRSDDFKHPGPADRSR